MAKTNIIALLLVLAMWTCSATSQRSEDSISDVEVIVESVKRTSENEATLHVHAANLSKKPVFAFGIKFPKRSNLYPVYLEHQTKSGSWEVVIPCVDTPPPHVLRIDPTKAIGEYVALKNPLLYGTCKKREVDFEGLFRFRLNYFETEKSATSNLQNFFSLDHPDASTRVTVSKPFLIPRYEESTKK